MISEILQQILINTFPLFLIGMLLSVLFMMFTNFLKS